MSSNKRRQDHKDQNRSPRSDRTKSNSSASQGQSNSTGDSNLSTRRLPVRPNLDQLKHQAKELLSDIRRGDPAAIEEFNAYYPRPTPVDKGGRSSGRVAVREERVPPLDAGETPAVPVNAGKVAAMLVNIKLADAQLALARSYEAPSWPRLVQCCKLIDAIWRDDVFLIYHLY